MLPYSTLKFVCMSLLQLCLNADNARGKIYNEALVNAYILNSALKLDFDYITNLSMFSSPNDMYIFVVYGIFSSAIHDS